MPVEFTIGDARLLRHFGDGPTGMTGDAIDTPWVAVAVGRSAPAPRPPFGLRVAMIFTPTCSRMLRTGLS
jgi:hypothetical protein